MENEITINLAIIKVRALDRRTTEEVVHAEAYQGKLDEFEKFVGFDE